MVTAQEVLTGALVECREALASGSRPTRGGEVELIEELIDWLGAEAGMARHRPAPAGTLGGWLVAIAGPSAARRAALADIAGAAARSLIVQGQPPPTVAGASAWQALVAAVDRIYGSGVHALGRLPFITDRLVDLLVDEARSQHAERPGEGRQRVGAPGRVLAEFAVSRGLRDAMSSAFGCPVVSTYSAVYLYDAPSSELGPHVDARGHELEFHLILEHTLPRDGSGGSALLAYLPGRSTPSRLELAPGEAVALRGRGTIHAWEPLGSDERRTLVGIGFRPGP